MDDHWHAIFDLRARIKALEEAIYVVLVDAHDDGRADDPNLSELAYRAGMTDLLNEGNE